MKSSKQIFKASLLSLLLLGSALPVAYAATETDTENTVENTTAAAGDAADDAGAAVTNAADNVQEAAQGFDDWGLLGLIGLLGLLGLGGRNRNVVVDGTRR